MVKNKHKVGHCFTIAWLQEIYKTTGVAHIATDGAYVQLEKETKKDSKGLQSQKSQ